MGAGIQNNVQRSIAVDKLAACNKITVQLPIFQIKVIQFAFALVVKMFLEQLGDFFVWKIHALMADQQHITHAAELFPQVPVLQQLAQGSVESIRSWMNGSVGFNQNCAHGP